MKKYLPLFLFLICCFTANSQTKQELLDKIENDINSIQMLLNMSNFRIEITSGEVENFDPEDGFNFEKNSLTQSAADKNTLQEFFSNLPIKSKIYYPYNIISVNKRENDLEKLLGYDHLSFNQNTDKEALYKLKEIVFLDGTKNKVPVINNESIIAKHKITEKDEDGETYEYVSIDKMSKIEELIWKGGSFDEIMALQAPKPVQSVSYNIELAIPTKKIYELNSKNKAANTIYGTITLDTIAGNKVYCTIPDIDQEDNLQIEAYYKNGKVLGKKGSSSNTIVTPTKKVMYEQWISTLNKAKEQVKKGNIKSDKELQSFYTANPVQMDDKDKQSYKTAVYSFSGPVDKLSFIVTDSLLRKENFEVTYDLKYLDGTDEFISMDFESEKIGLLDKEGKWIVQPQFNEYFRPLNRYFYTDQIDDHENTFHYNPATKTIQKVNYNLDDPEIYGGKYVKIEPYTNGPNGLADVFTGKIVLPMEYEYIRFQSKKFWQVEKNGKEGILNNELKTIMPIIYDNADAKGDYIIAGNEGGKTDIYDENGKNITNGKYDDIHGTFSDGLLLVGKRVTNKEGYIDTNNYYIDTSCNVKIDINAKGYEDPEEFSAGLAVVQNKSGEYGYINTKGELVIPFQYEYAMYFYPSSKLALVKLEDRTYALIDQKGNIVKKLPGDFVDSKFREADRASRILMEDRKSFNEYGEELEYESNDYW